MAALYLGCFLISPSIIEFDWSWLERALAALARRNFGELPRLLRLCAARGLGLGGLALIVGALGLIAEGERKARRGSPVLAELGLTDDRCTGVRGLADIP